MNDGSRDVDTGHGTHVAVSAARRRREPPVSARARPPRPGCFFQSIENYATTSLLCEFLGVPSGYYLTGIPANLGDLFQQAYTGGARVHSNSWGSASAGQYTTDSVNADAFVWSHRDMTVTFSAGNEGVDADADGRIDDDSMGAPGTAKNVISVGASENDRASDYPCDATKSAVCAAQGGQNHIFTWWESWPFEFPAEPLKSDPSAGNAEQVAAFSSRGPTDDGRIKPDVVAPGSWVLSGYSDLYQEGYDTSPNPQNGAFQYDGWGYPLNDKLKYLGGTSMANPLVAGGAAVVRDFYQQLHGHSASAALVKATLVNSAQDLLDENNDGVDDNALPVPNTSEGWGRVDLAAATDGSREFVDDGAGLATGGVGELFLRRRRRDSAQDHARLVGLPRQSLGEQDAGERPRPRGRGPRRRLLPRQRLHGRLVGRRRLGRQHEQPRERLPAVAGCGPVDGHGARVQRAAGAAAVRPRRLWPGRARTAGRARALGHAADERNPDLGRRLHRVRDRRRRLQPSLRGGILRHAERDPRHGIRARRLDGRLRREPAPRATS